MPTGIELSSGAVVGVPKPLDAKYGPYDSVALALADLSSGYRYQGLTVGIKDGGSIVEYWFKDGVANENFVEKIPPEATPDYLEFTSSSFFPATGEAGKLYMAKDTEELYRWGGNYYVRVKSNWDFLINKPSTFLPSTHIHSISDVTGLSTALAGKQPTGDYATLEDGKVPIAQIPTHNHVITEVVGLTQALAGKQPTGDYATLENGKVPSSQLPSFVDDVLEFSSYTAFPASGETGTIYVALDSNKIYRWSGSAYVEITASPGSTDEVPEGSTNLYHTPQRAISALYGGLIPINGGLPVVTRTDGGISHSTFGTSQGQFAEGNHTHDDRYYTEPEVDTALAEKLGTPAVEVISPAANQALTLAATSSPTFRVVKIAGTITGSVSVYLPATAATNAILHVVVVGAFADSSASVNVLATTPGSGGAGTISGLITASSDNKSVTVFWNPITLNPDSSLGRWEALTVGVHEHDNRYYTETETDALLASKQNTLSRTAIASSVSQTIVLPQYRNRELSISNYGGTLTFVLPRMQNANSEHDSAKDGDIYVFRASTLAAGTTTLVTAYTWTGSSYIGTTSTLLTLTTGTWTFMLRSGSWVLESVQPHDHASASTTSAGFMSSADKTKLDTVASGAEVNVNADWNATSGDAFILNKPTIPAITPNAGPSFIYRYGGTGTGQSFSNSGFVGPSNVTLSDNPANSSPVGGFGFYGAWDDLEYTRLWVNPKVLFPYHNRFRIVALTKVTGQFGDGIWTMVRFLSPTDAQTTVPGLQAFGGLSNNSQGGNVAGGLYVGQSDLLVTDDYNFYTTFIAYFAAYNDGNGGTIGQTQIFLQGVNI